MKKAGILLMVLLLLLPGFCTAEEANVLTGSSRGFGGSVTVELTVEEGKITNALVTGDNETPTIGGAAFAALQQQIVDAQGAEIDGVSGATVTSTAVSEAVAAALSASAGDTKPRFVPGTYSAAAFGMWKDVVVSVTVDEERITDVQVTDCGDTPIVAEAAIQTVPARIVEHQSLVVDTATGATVTSNAIISAVKTAIAPVTENMTALMQPLPETERQALADETYDVVIVGAGGAGISAALEVARTSDYSVLLLEKESWIGGSTALSGGGISVVNTPKNRGEGIDFVLSNDGQVMDCTPDDIVAYYSAKTETLSKRPKDMWINEDLVRRIFERSESLYPYLMENGLDQRVGLPAKDSEGLGAPGKGILGVMSADGFAAGATWGKWFSELAMENGAEIRVNSKVTELVVEDGAVTGVVVETPDSTYTVHAKKVILTTGGFAHDREKLQEHNAMFSGIEKVWSFCAPGCTGDALEMTKKVDAATTGYGMIMVFGVEEPHAYDSTIGEPIQIVYLLVDKDGKRFVDELDWYYEKIDAVMDLPETMCYGIVGPNFPFYAKHGEDMNFDDWMSILLENGWATAGNSVAELAEVMGMDPAALQESVDFYNDRLATNPTDRFGAAIYPIEEGQPIYAIQVEPVAIETMYGLKQDTQMRVLNTAGDPIPNLYAAGMVGGGNYMLQKYYCTTNAVAIAVYGGSLAGEEVVHALNAAQ